MPEDCYMRDGSKTRCSVEQRNRSSTRVSQWRALWKWHQGTTCARARSVARTLAVSGVARIPRDRTVWRPLRSARWSAADERNLVADVADLCQQPLLLVDVAACLADRLTVALKLRLLVLSIRSRFFSNSTWSIWGTINARSSSFKPSCKTRSIGACFGSCKIEPHAGLLACALAMRRAECVALPNRRSVNLPAERRHLRYKCFRNILLRMMDAGFSADVGAR